MYSTLLLLLGCWITSNPCCDGWIIGRTGRGRVPARPLHAWKLHKGSWPSEPPRPPPRGRGGGGNDDGRTRWRNNRREDGNDEWMVPLDYNITSPQMSLRGGGRDGGSMVKSKARQKHLQKTPIKKIVILPDTTILPKSVVALAARKAGIVGGKPLMDGNQTQIFRQVIDAWYDRQGYPLHHVREAEVQLLDDDGDGLSIDSSPTGAKLVIYVQEPVVADPPIDLVFCKELLIDPESGALVTAAEYSRKKTNAPAPNDPLMLRPNSTMLQTTGRTKARKLAAAMQMEPGKPFRVQPGRWDVIARSGIFRRVFRVMPQKVADTQEPQTGQDAIQLQVVAQEAACRHLEYGLGKSLYTGAWEGELDFSHANWLGGGEVLGVSLRRASRGAPSFRIRFSDDRFGFVESGGYELEAFCDYLGDDKELGQQIQLLDDDEKLRDRRGVTACWRTPFRPPSSIRLSLEKTTPVDNMEPKHYASTAWTVGPVLFGGGKGSTTARASCEGQVVSGVQGSFAEGNRQVTPYVTGTASSRQIIPLQLKTAKARHVNLAFRHSATASSPLSLPSHEARALGIANNIRHDVLNGKLTTCLRGTTEIRIPVDVPRQWTSPDSPQDGTVVFFSDWLLSREANPRSLSDYRRHRTSRLPTKTSMGVALRKTIQGVPLKYDLYYTRGNIRMTFGLGQDFDV